jgi:hypothetical protein
MQITGSIKKGIQEFRRSSTRCLSGRLQTLIRDESGAAAVFGALTFPLVVGGMGLSAEAGYLYMSQRKLQHMADVSAHAAAVRLRTGDTKSHIEAAARYVAETSGLVPGSAALTINIPPLSGPLAGNNQSVEVLISKPQPRLLSAIFKKDPYTLAARAVVRLDKGSQACVLALSRTASAAVKVAGSTEVTLKGCDVASNSVAPDAFNMDGAGRLESDCVYTVGGAVTTANLTLNTCGAPKENSTLTADPYAALAEPDITGSCRSKNVDSTTPSPMESRPDGLQFMRFCNGLDVKGTVTFSPGLYIIENGDFTVNAGAELSGTGVTFYLANGAALKLNGHAKVNLTAPTSGPYAGLLFFGERDSTVEINQVNGSSGSTFDGAIYFPSSTIEYSGKTSLTGCTQIIGDQIVFTGNSEVVSECQAAGTRPIVTNQSIAFAE